MSGIPGMDGLKYMYTKNGDEMMEKGRSGFGVYLLAGATASLTAFIIYACRNLGKENISPSKDKSDEIAEEARARARKIIDDAAMVGAWWNESPGQPILK